MLCCSNVGVGLAITALLGVLAAGLLCLLWSLLLILVRVLGGTNLSRCGGAGADVGQALRL